MRNELVVSVSPGRCNIVYKVVQFNSIQETFSPLVTAVSQQALLIPKIIIYSFIRNTTYHVFIHCMAHWFSYQLC